MAQIDRLLGQIKRLQAEYAIDALANPPESGREFAYGKHCGFMDGLRRAEQLVLAEREDEKRDRLK